MTFDPCCSATFIHSYILKLIYYASDRIKNIYYQII